MPPEVFWPRPKVHSAIMQIVLEPEKRGAIGDRSLFHDFVRRLFLHRRKLLRGVLLAAYGDRLDKPTVDAVLSRLNFDPTSRAEELNVDQMLALCEQVHQALLS